MLHYMVNFTVVLLKGSRISSLTWNDPEPLSNSRLTPLNVTTDTGRGSMRNSQPRCLAQKPVQQRPLLPWQPHRQNRQQYPDRLLRIRTSQKKELGNVLNADGKLTEAEKERRRAKGLCFYCGEPPEKCQHRKMPATSSRATFTISGEPPVEASIKEVSDDTPAPSEN